MPGTPGYLREFSDPVNGEELQEPQFGRGENPPYPSRRKFCIPCANGNHQVCDDMHLWLCHCWRAFHDPESKATLYDERPADYNTPNTNDRKRK